MCIYTYAYGSRETYILQALLQNFNFSQVHNSFIPKLYFFKLINCSTQDKEWNGIKNHFWMLRIALYQLCQYVKTKVQVNFPVMQQIHTYPLVYLIKEAKSWA